MKSLVESFIVAFSMYSKVPMPRIAWNDKNMRYAMLFFPFVGVALAGVMAAAFFGLAHLGLSPVFSAAILVAIPVLFTGGIHIDGFCDTCDAISSHQDRENKLRIMQDPNIGAFAMIDVCVLFLIQLGAYTQLLATPKYVGMVLLGFFISRCLSGYAVLQFPCAKTKGLAATFAAGAQKTIAKRVLLGWIIVASILLLWIYLIWGAVLLGIIAVSYYIFYRWMQKEFGGMTGDLAGFCLQVIEFLFLIVAAIMGGITA